MCRCQYYNEVILHLWLEIKCQLSADWLVEDNNTQQQWGSCLVSVAEEWHISGKTQLHVWTKIPTTDSISLFFNKNTSYLTLQLILASYMSCILKYIKTKIRSWARSVAPFGLSPSIIRCFIDHMALRWNCSISIFQALIQYVASVNRLGFQMFSEDSGGL